MNAYSYVIIDGFKYAVQQGTYIRKWQRQFTATLPANLVELNWIDRGPGIRTYDFTLHVVTWPTDSKMYQLGITQDLETQISNLENSYLKPATSIQFIDVFGQNANPNPDLDGVYFTNLTYSVPNYSTSEKPYLLVDIELIESKASIGGTPGSKFVVGQSIAVTSSVNVRATPTISGTLLGTENPGATGSIRGGPTAADGYTWWQVQYADGLLGWSIQDDLAGS